MNRYNWISKQPLETLETPHPHSNSQGLLDALEASALSLVNNASFAMKLLNRAGEQELEHIQDMDQMDAKFQICCKYNAWGYNSAEEMMKSEPEMVAVAEGRALYSDTVIPPRVGISAQDRALNYARAIIDLQHQLIVYKHATFCSEHFDSLNRKVVHEFVKTANKHADPMLPKLKTTTIEKIG